MSECSIVSAQHLTLYTITVYCSKRYLSFVTNTRSTKPSSVTVSSLLIYRFFFKTFCEEIDEEIMEEISDDETILPHFNGKIVARVETVA